MSLNAAMARQPFTRPELVEQLRALGVQPGGVLVVHTSFRALGPVEGGPLGLIESLQEAIGPEGTLVMPSMSDDAVTRPYDPATTPATGMGIVAEIFRTLPGILRGDHSTSSFAASGRLANAIAAPQPLAPPHGLDSPIGRVYHLDGQIMLLGIDHTANTTIHLAESLARVPYRIRKSALVNEQGTPRRVKFDETDHCCERFAIVDDWLRDAGLQSEGIIGQAPARLMRSRDVVRTVVPRLRWDPTLFLHPPGSCAECDAAWASVPKRGRL